jgi:hypothetical protein
MSKKLGAPYGNKNAEKWTFRKAVQLYQDAIELSEEVETYYMKVNEKAVEVTGYKYDFIGEIARELGTFHQLMTRHLPERFPSLNRLKNTLISNLEANCYANAKKGTIKEATGIVNLKSNHKWQDRQSVDHTTKGESMQPKTIIVTNEESKKIIQKFDAAD